jgi:DNA-binding transcriptional LysR family regulator
MAMELNEIEAFVTISRSGSFTRAATILYISQPAISRRIELLERELGAPLFERLPTGVRLTEAGQAFLPYAQQVLAAMRDGAAAVRSLEEEEQGSITLALVGTLASTRLTEQLQKFRETYPNVRLLLRTARSDEVSDPYSAFLRGFGPWLPPCQHTPSPRQWISSGTVEPQRNCACELTRSRWLRRRVRLPKGVRPAFSRPWSDAKATDPGAFLGGKPGKSCEFPGTVPLRLHRATTVTNVVAGAHNGFVPARVPHWPSPMAQLFLG